MTFDEALVVTNEPREDFVALDDALEALAKFDERKSRVVELRFFGGLTVEETASVVKVSPETVMRDWQLAKVWLQREMRGDRSPDPERSTPAEELSARAVHAADRLRWFLRPIRTHYGSTLSTQLSAKFLPPNSGQRSEAAVHKTADRAADADIRRWSRCWCRRRTAASRPSHRSRCPLRHSSSPECHRRALPVMVQAAISA